MFYIQDVRLLKIYKSVINWNIEASPKSWGEYFLNGFDRPVNFEHFF